MEVISAQRVRSVTEFEICCTLGGSEGTAKDHDSLLALPAALRSCRSASVFRRINTLLGNTLNLHGVCLTPPASRTPERLRGGRRPRPTRGEPPVVAHLGTLFAQKLLLESKSCESKTHQNLPDKVAQTFTASTSCCTAAQAMNKTEPTSTAELDIIRHQPTVRRGSMKDSGMRLVHGETLLFADVSTLLAQTFSYGDKEESYGVQISSEVLERSSIENAAYPAIVPCDIDKDEVKRTVPVDHSRCSCAAPVTDGKIALKWKGNFFGSSHYYYVYSSKVFIGGIPWTMTEAQLLNKVHNFGSLTVEWPNKDQYCGSNFPRGYAYMVFKSEAGVRMLLNACSCKRDSLGHRRFLYKLMFSGYHKQVEVIPWVLGDNKWELEGAIPPRERHMVFVGALHGLMTASNLSSIMNDLFGGVIHVGIDIDKYKYPIGSGRVTFDNRQSYIEALTAAYVEITTKRFSKKIQIDPYLEDALCSMCNNLGGLFCRELVCLKYFCKICWKRYHCKIKTCCHQPLERTPRSNAGR